MDGYPQWGIRKNKISYPSHHYSSIRIHGPLSFIDDDSLPNSLPLKREDFSIEHCGKRWKEDFTTLMHLHSVIIHMQALNGSLKLFSPCSQCNRKIDIVII